MHAAKLNPLSLEGSACLPIGADYKTRPFASGICTAVRRPAGHQDVVVSPPGRTDPG